MHHQKQPSVLEYIEKTIRRVFLSRKVAGCTLATLPKKKLHRSFSPITLQAFSEKLFVQTLQVILCNIILSKSFTENVQRLRRSENNTQR